MNPGFKYDKNILFVIVCYKEKYWETETFTNLHRSYEAAEDTDSLSVFIVDNTDLIDWNISNKPATPKNVTVDYINLKNPGISVAYNRAYEYARENSFKWIVFLDQDTTLPLETFRIYKNAALSDNVHFPLKAPLIYYSENALLSPSTYKNYRYGALSIHKNIEKIQFKDVSCINTGLMILTEFFLQNNKYDETLRLDFCDHDFIERSKQYLTEIEILPLELHQNFSTHTNNKADALKRYEFYSRDMMAFAKNRNKLLIFFLVDIPRLIKLTLKYKSVDFLKIRIKNNKSL